MEKIKIEHHTVSGGLWLAAWLFTIGYLHLTFWEGVLAVVIWPYYLGSYISTVGLRDTSLHPFAENFDSAWKLTSLSS